MARRSKPRAGSKGYYPRVRARSIIPKFKTFKKTDDLKILNIYGYKVGMCHIMALNKHKGSPLNNHRQAISTTIMEFPPLTIFGIRFYEKQGTVLKALKDFVLKDKADKEVFRVIKGLKRQKKNINYDEIKKYFEENKNKITEIRFIAHTNPKLTTLPKKKPEVVELYTSGNLDDIFKMFSEKLGKELNIDEVFEEQLYLDAKAITTGKGFQGAIKRFGIKRRVRKSEKGVRRVGTFGPWHPPLIMHTLPMPGQMGFHNRTVLNIKLLKILNSSKINKKSGFKRYGIVKTKAGLIAGSIPGPVKRIVEFRKALRNQ